MMAEKLFEMRNFDKGDYLEQARILKMVSIASMLWNSLRGTDGKGDMFSVHKAAWLRPRSRSLHMRLQTQLGHFALWLRPC